MQPPAYMVSRLPEAYRGSSVRPAGYVPGEWVATYLGGIASGNPIEAGLGAVEGSQRQAPPTTPTQPPSPPVTPPAPSDQGFFEPPPSVPSPGDQGQPPPQTQPPQPYDTTGLTTDMLPMLTSQPAPSRLPWIIGGVAAVAAVGAIVYFATKRR